MNLTSGIWWIFIIILVSKGRLMISLTVFGDKESKDLVWGL